MPRFLAFDLETTGLDKEKDRIVEFCLLELDAELKVISRWTERVHPGVPIPPEVSKIHGIHDADVADCRPFSAYSQRIQRLVKEAVLIGYNIDYDIDLLHYELQRVGLPGIAVNHPRIDALSLFREFVPDLYRLTGAVRHYLGREHTNAHGAEADAEAAVDILRAQRQQHPEVAARLGDASGPGQPAIQWLDRGHKFYADAQGVIRFAFGNNRDKPVQENLSMLEWILERDFAEDTKVVARRLRVQLKRVP